MVFNTIFNNISVISCQSVLLVEETGENHRPVTSQWQTLSHNVVSKGIRTHNFIGDRHNHTTTTIQQKVCMLILIVIFD